MYENLSNLRADLEKDVRGIAPFKASEALLRVLDEDLDALESVHQVRSLPWASDVRLIGFHLQCGRSQSKICKHCAM